MKYQQVAFIVFCELVFQIATNPQETVDSDIWKNLQQSKTVNVLVSFKNTNTSDAAARFHSLRFTGRNAILNGYHDILKDHTDFVQKDVMSMLNKLRTVNTHKAFQLWITAELIVRNADKDIIQMLASHPDVMKISIEFFIPLLPLLLNVETDRGNGAEWGVKQIGAEDAWNGGTSGEGIVVSAIDTGVRYKHQDLKDNYRGRDRGDGVVHDYNWYDATTPITIPLSGPYDTHGHGTHITGTMCGRNGLGVAPSSEWIHCRGCGNLQCSSLDLIECGHFIACPTKRNGEDKDCTKAPNVVNNSWGGAGGSSFYDAIIEYWHAVNIIPVFAAGNSGPACSTIGSPGDRNGTIAVASTNISKELSSFSSIGRPNDILIKPDISAPGENIRSASYLFSNGYRNMSGTSMATPHVTGAVALILSKHPGIGFKDVVSRLTTTAKPLNPANKNCEGKSDSVIPNIFFGFGLINVNDAVTQV